MSFYNGVDFPLDEYPDEWYNALNKQMNVLKLF